jgi:hypothetical protein
MVGPKYFPYHLIQAYLVSGMEGEEYKNVYVKKAYIGKFGYYEVEFEHDGCLGSVQCTSVFPEQLQVFLFNLIMMDKDDPILQNIKDSLEEDT